jgi:hypothetical protein
MRVHINLRHREPFEKRSKILPPKFGEKRLGAEKFANKRERLGANRIHITVALRSNDNFIPLQAAAIISARSSQSQYAVHVYELLTHTQCGV